MLRELKRQFFDIRAGEWGKAIGMSLSFFLIIATFWVLKPIKRGVILSYYADDPLQLLGWSVQAAEAEQLGKVLNMVVAFGAVVLFTMLVKRLHRQHVIWIFCGSFSTIFVLFGLTIDNLSAALVWSLYVYGDIFNTVMVALFWAFMNDIVVPDQAKRLYGLVGLGGVVGGFVGATVVNENVEAIGRSPLLFACILPMVLIAFLTWWVGRDSGDQGSQQGIQGPKKSNAAIEGARLVLRSKYLLGIAALIGIYEIVSNIVDFQLASVIQLEVEGSRAKDAYMGLVGQITGIASIVIQLLVTSFVMRKFGVGVALLFLPLAILAGSTGFLLLPTLAFATAMSASDNALNYSINQSAKEALYVPTTREQKYKAKAFIDMFVQRTAKVLAVAVNLAVAHFVGLENIRWLAIVSIALLMVWITIARFLGNRFAAKAKQPPRDAASEPPPTERDGVLGPKPPASLLDRDRASDP